MIQPEVAFRAVLDAAPDAMLGVDAGGTIVWASSRVHRVFGWEPDALVGQPVEVLVPDAARTVHPRHRAAYAAEPEPRPMGLGLELSARRRDGTTFPAEISLSAVGEGAAMIVVAAVRDVTEQIESRATHERLRAQLDREALEAQLHQARRLESLGQLAGGVAHDVNNLLGAILNYATFARDDVQRSMPGDQAGGVLRDLEQIIHAVERGAALTRQLLAFSRREAIQPTLLDLNAVTRGVEDLLRRTIGEDVLLEVNLDARELPVLADRGQLEQVLMNLAVNARDAMAGAGGSLIVDTRLIDADESYAASTPGVRPGRYARVRVSDTGAGMVAEVAERAFEPFFTTKARGQGTGLGLATVYGIVSQAGGLTRIYSEPGHGTSVVVLLPLSDATPTDEPPERPTVDLDGHETVLVVEDDPDLREVTTRILLRHGYRVIAAADGPRALELATSHTGPIDVMLTDVVMPRMLGKELAERLRVLRPGTPVVFMSGYAEPVLSSRGTLEVGTRLIDKPFTAETLLTGLRQVLG